MALYRCGSSGGTAKCASGVFTTNEAHTVNCGFRPKYIGLVWTNTANTYYYYALYNANIDANKVLMYNGSKYVADLPNTSQYNLNSVTDTGFTCGKMGTYKFLYWFAATDE